MAAPPHKKLYDLLRKAVAKSYEPGSSTGVLLSGGIDSSTVACLAPELPLFTGYYAGADYDEREWARIVANGREHYEIEITPKDFIYRIDDCLRAIEPPFEGPGTFGQYMVAEFVRQHVELALSGEGGDELFGGYARLMAVAGHPLPEGYENYVPPKDYPANLHDALEWEWEHLPALLRVDEQVTSAHGLRCVAPMLDEDVVAYVLSLPDELRVGKGLLRAAMFETVPEEILNRRDKRGFPVPYVQWAQHEPVRSFVAERIGYVPDPSQPWDRKWWLDFCEASLVAA